MIFPNQLYVLKIVLIIAMIISNNVYAEVITCRSEKLKICSEKNCEDKPSKTSIILDTEKSTYQRCDDSCDLYSAKMKRSGAFLSSSPEIGTFIKINQIDNSFIDVASISSIILVNYGVCR